MKNRYTSFIIHLLGWIQKNSLKIVVAIAIEALVLVFFSLPYLNIIGVYLAFIPYLVMLALISKLFQPGKEFFLITALALFGVSLLLQLSSLTFANEILGNISYFFIWTYLILSLSELRKTT